MQVLAWRLTKGTSLDEISKLLRGIKECHLSLDIQYIAVDNCCQIRDKLINIFGESVNMLLNALQGNCQQSMNIDTYSDLNIV